MRNGDTTPPSDPKPSATTGLRRGYEVKASAFRLYITQIEKLGLIPSVLTRVHPETRGLIENPPLPGTWMDAGPIEDMIGALAFFRGFDAVRAVTRSGQMAGGLTILKPILSGLLHLFGATPH